LPKPLRSEDKKAVDVALDNKLNIPEERSIEKRKSRFNPAAVLWVIIATVTIGGIITHGSEIMDAIWLIRTENPESITIPHLSVKLHNNGTEPISLPTKGQCFLWPPEPHSWDYECGYVFKQVDKTDIDSEVIYVPAQSELNVLIHVTKTLAIHQTETSLKRFFSTLDWHIQFIMVTDQNGWNIINSSHIPFTMEAMSRGYVFEVFRQPSNGNS
jgi:hypothetical protein